MLGLHVIDLKGLDRLKTEFINFVKQIAQPDTIEDLAAIRIAIQTHGFTTAQFLPNFGTKL